MTMPISSSLTPTYGATGGAAYAIGSLTSGASTGVSIYPTTTAVNSSISGTWATNTWYSPGDVTYTDVNVSGKLTVKGKNIIDVIENIEQRLAILHPNPELEERWENLKALADQYRALEQEIIEKEQMWNLLKK